MSLITEDFDRLGEELETGPGHDIGRERFVVMRSARYLAARRSVLAKHLAYSPLGY